MFSKITTSNRGSFAASDRPEGYERDWRTGAAVAAADIVRDTTRQKRALIGDQPTCIVLHRSS